jgi:uncharacterized phage protein (TIGR02220 family)
MSSANWPWFRLYIDWISHPKVQMLSEADQRRYVCLMCMQSAGRLRRATIENIVFELRISVDEANATIERLKKAKLLDKDGCIHNWDDRQPKRDHSAERTAKYRAKKKLGDAAETSQERFSDADVTRCDGHSDALDQIRVDHTRPEKEKTIPPTPRKRVAVDGVVEVVEYLNQVTGRGFSLDRGNKFIEQAFKRGATVDECREVIDRCWHHWRDKPDFVGKVDKSTPFREANFDRYLDEWRAGKANTGESGTKPKIVLSPEHQRLMEDLKKIAADAGVET